MFEVIGVGALLMDHLLRVSEAYLASISGEKWGMKTVDYNEILTLIENSSSVPVQIPGGSAANAIKGLAGLGRKCALVGMTGRDAVGEKVQDDLQDRGVVPLMQYGKSPTGHVVCLITPDGSRTCRTYGGASLEMRPENLDPEVFSGAKLVHLEGYTLLCPGLTRAAMKMAKNAGAAVSFDLASFEMVHANRELILELLPLYVDVVFANEREAYALTDQGPEKSCAVLKAMCEVGVVMMGSKGCIAGSREMQIHCPAVAVDPIDTTGAGDLFASGFLHGYLSGRSLQDCAALGSIVASEVIQVVGAEIPSNRFKSLFKI